jgi:hypothetical protein
MIPITDSDSDIIAVLMGNLADAMTLLRLALRRISDGNDGLKGRIETTLKEMQLSRMKVLTLLVEEHPSPIIELEE